MRIRLPGPWQHPEFLKVWGSNTISVFGVYATSLALPLTAVTWARRPPRWACSPRPRRCRRSSSASSWDSGLTAVAAARS